MHDYCTVELDLYSMETPFGTPINSDDIDSVSGYDNSITLAADLWSSLNYLRGYDLEEIATHILCLLTLEKYGYLDKLEAREQIEDLLSSNKTTGMPHRLLLKKLCVNGNLLLKHISATENGKIVKQIQQVKSRGFYAHFGRFFDDLLYRLYSLNSKTGGAYLSTPYVRGLMLNFANPSEEAQVFNPFAGLLSFGLRQPNAGSYYGQEINDRAFDLARLRAIAHGVTLGPKFLLVQEDSFLAWPRSKRFDLVIANPPFGVRLNRYTKEIAAYRGAQNFLVRNGVELLKADGKLVTLVTLGFLFRSGAEQETRQFLIESDLLETIVILPQGMLNGTAIGSAIIVVNKRKKVKGFVKIAAPAAFRIDKKSGTSRHRGPMFTGDIVARVNSLDYPNESVYPAMSDMRLVANEEIVKNDYALDGKRYLLEQFTGTPLDELLTPLAGATVKPNFNGRLTTIQNLASHDQTNYQIGFDALTVDEVATGEYRLPRNTKRIEKSALLIAMIGRKLKPTYFRSEVVSGNNLPVFLSPQVKAFSHNHRRVDRDYLIHQLRSEAVRQQLEAYQKGSTQPRISVKDFLRIKIQLPSLQEQRMIMRALNEVNDKMEALRKERNALAHGKRILDNTRFASLKHALGRPQQSILSAAKSIKGYLDHSGEEGEKLNRSYANFFEQERTISDTLQGIINDIDFISRMMDRGESGLQVEAYELEGLSANRVLKTVKELGATGFKFKLKVNAEPDKEWGVVSFLLNRELLRVLLDNLLTNADKHGFQQKAPGNLVQITLSIIAGYLVLEVQNNGKPFPANFGQAQYVQEFKTNNMDTGQGIGGYQVDLIAKYFNNPDWELIVDAEELFPVSFIFRFPVYETAETL